MKKKTRTVILFFYVKEVQTGLKAANDLNVNVLRSGISPEAINSPHFGSIIILPLWVIHLEKRPAFVRCHIPAGEKG